MKTLALIAATMLLASTAGAQVPAPPAVNDAEFKCMVSSAKAEGKFAVTKAKCISKCFLLAWKGAGPFSDCMPPYGGSTAQCIFDSTYFLKGAENKFELAMKKYCVIASYADCPECYEGGDCASAISDRVQERENILDSFVPGVFCETTGALPEEIRCQYQTEKSLTRYYALSLNCYSKCFSDARGNGLPMEDCLPPIANSRWYGCLTSVRAKAEASIHKYCHDTSTPLAAPECGPDPYPDGPQWVGLMASAVESVLPNDYCASPSGAFLD
jgi:hypothetical protein